MWDATRFYKVRRLRRAVPLSDARPALDVPLAAYGERIVALAAASHARHARPVFVTQPVLRRRGLSERAEALLWFGWFAEGTRVHFLTAERLREVMDRYNAALVAACERAGAECVDVTAMSGDERYFLDDCHFTDAGSEELARRLAEWFRAHP
jgi:hypothetical protein